MQEKKRFFSLWLLLFLNANNTVFSLLFRVNYFMTQKTRNNNDYNYF